MSIEIRALCVSLFLVSFAAVGDSAETADSLGIDLAAITVSGISAGGIMAHQLHIAYPEVFSGAGIIAGVPWNCASGLIATAFARCMATAAGDLQADTIVAEIQDASVRGEIGDAKLLADDRVWLFHGAADTVVGEDVSNVLAEVYRQLIDPDRVQYRTDLQAAHNFPTADRGHACDVSESPWIGACGFDAAGELLGFLYPQLHKPADSLEWEMSETTIDGTPAGLSDSAFMFIPDTCRSDKASCRMHLVLHGCGQSTEQIGMTFIEESGYLAWASANDIILAFPQVVPSPVNPLACWDWWGYTGENYLSREGAQMKALVGWIEGITT